MPMSLRLVDDAGADQGNFDVPASGATIGRSADATITLDGTPQNMSRFHCEIRPDHYQTGWILLDTSKNGTFLNDGAMPIGRDNAVGLHDGDVIRLGDNRLVVMLRQAADLAPPPAMPTPQDNMFKRPNPSGDIGDPFDDFNDLRYDPGAIPSGPGPRGSGHDNLSQGGFPPVPADDPFAAFDLDQPELSGPTRSDHASNESLSFTPPQARSDTLPDSWDDLMAPPPAPSSSSGAGNLLPDSWDDEPLMPPSPVVQPPQPAVRPPQPLPQPLPQVQRPDAVPPPRPSRPQGGGGGGDALSAFLRGAGLPEDGAGFDTAQMEAAGALFRAFVDGTRALVQTRAKIKNEFRIEQTIIGNRDNNPLKFSLGTDDALAALLAPSERGYLAPAAAVKQVFDDLIAHELALMVAIQAALSTVLKRLSPETLKTRLGTADAKVGWFGGGGANQKVRLWDLYEALSAELTGTLRDDFDSIFGPVFARAYEEQISRL